jgi:hypothetical protein
MHDDRRGLIYGISIAAGLTIDELIFECGTVRIKQK